VGTLLSNKSPSKVIIMGAPKKSDVPTSKPQQEQPDKEEESPKIVAPVAPVLTKKRDLKRKCKQSNTEEPSHVSDPSPALI